MKRTGLATPVHEWSTDPRETRVREASHDSRGARKGWSCSPAHSRPSGRAGKQAIWTNQMPLGDAGSRDSSPWCAVTENRARMWRKADETQRNQEQRCLSLCSHCPLP